MLIKVTITLLADVLMNQGYIPDDVGLLVKSLTVSHRCRLVGWLAVNPKLSVFAGIPLNQECALLHPISKDWLVCPSMQN